MAIIGTGTTITFQSGYLAEILNVSGGDTSRAEIPTSNFATSGGMTYIPGALVDNGTYEVECIMDATDDVQAVMVAAAETVTITWPVAGSTVTWAASAFATGFSFSAPLEDRVTCTLTLRISGDRTTLVV